MWVFAWCWLASASAGDVQALVEREWARSAPADLVAAAPEDDPAARAVLARALGRLRDPAALAALEGLRGDADPAVRLAVAEALAWTPGAAPAIRAWLDALPPPAVDPLRPPDRLRPALFAALGHHAEAADVPRLVAALAEPGAPGDAAAIALGRLGRAGVSETAGALPALAAGVSAPDSSRADAFAFALYRIGLSEADDATLARVRTTWASLAGSPARAWVLRATWPRIPAEERTTALATALADSAPVVRVAALDALREDDVPSSRIAPLLADPHPWIRRAAIAALGRLGDRDAVAALTPLAADADPWIAAAAIEALGAAGAPPDPAAGLAADRPMPVRATVAGTLEDPERLLALALDDPEGAVRTAAAGTLLGLEDPDPAWVPRLLGASDPAVREAGVALAEGLDDPGAALRAHLATETDPLVAQAIRVVLGDTPTPWAPPEGVPTDLGAIANLRVATVHTDKGTFRITLLPEVAPIAVASFAALAERDVFDGLLFHRVVPAFVVQGGDPRGDGWGGPGYALPDEVSAIPYDVGAVGMARSDRDTGGSQWFVTLTPQPHLTGDYTLFGQVSDGMHVVKALQRGDRIRDVVIERVAR